MPDVNSNIRSRSQRGYDRLAPVYQALEWLAFGNQLQHARCGLIDELPAWRRMLILGDGNGRLLEQLCIRRQSTVSGLDQDSVVKVTSVDHSLAMLSRQRSRIDQLGCLQWMEFVHVDALQFEPDLEVYDVLVTNFFLDCFTCDELETHMPQWLQGLRPLGLLYHVDFILPHSPRQRPRARLLLFAMHVFFRWQTALTNRRLVDTQPILEKHGLRKVAEQISEAGLIATQLWQKF